MNYLDLVIAIPLLWGIWKGWQRGLVFEIAMIIGLVLGIYLAFKFMGVLQSLVGKYVHGSAAALPYITFFLIFITVILLMILLAKLLEGILKMSSLTPLNKVGGSLFGLIKFAFVVSIILNMFRPVDTRLGIISSDTRTKSYLYSPVMNLSHYIFPALQDVRQQFSRELQQSSVNE